VKPTHMLAFCALFLLFSTVVTAQQPAATADQEITVPNLIKFTGTLKDLNGQPRIGTIQIKFGLYASQEGGDPLWNETQLVQTDAGGNYSIYLGASEKTGLPLDLFSSQKARWLGIQVQGDEEQARALFVSVPYALKAADADTVGGKPLSSFVLYDDLTVPQEDEVSSTGESQAISGKGLQSTKLAEALGLRTGKTPGRAWVGGAVPLSTSGSTDQIAKFINSTDLGDSVMTESGGKIGIGTTAPISKLNLAVDGASDYFTLSSYNANLYDKGFLVRSARGSAGTASATQPGDILFNLYAQGHDGADYSIASGIRMAVDGSVSTGKVPGVMSFLTSDSTGAYTERMRINSAGNVGIGTATPSQKLEISGNVKASGIVFPDASSLTSATAAQTRAITYLAGCDTCSALADNDDQRTIYFNLVGPMTINSVTCFSDAGTPTINLQRDSGAPTNILSSDLACSTTGTTSTGIVSAQSILNLSDKVDFVIVSAGGVAKRVTVAIKATVN
jgi:hypothetical protein